MTGEGAARFQSSNFLVLAAFNVIQLPNGREQ